MACSRCAAHRCCVREALGAPSSRADLATPSKGQGSPFRREIANLMANSLAL